jgi:hypothetical protein
MKRYGLLVVLAGALGGCGGGQCYNLEEVPGASMTGSLTYTEGDGRSVTAAVAGDQSGALEQQFYVTGDGSGMGVFGTFVDSSGFTRDYVLTVGGLSSGSTTNLAGNGSVCFQRETDGQPICSPLVGTMTVSTISSDCAGAAGVYQCAQTLNATLSGTSSWEGTLFVIRASFSETGEAVPGGCSDD